MDKQKILDALSVLRANSPKRKFSQTVEMIVNLKDIDIKKAENNVDTFTILPNGRGKKIKTCAFVDDEQVLEAKKHCDFVIEKDKFPAMDKKTIKNIAGQVEFMLSQANLMPQVAANFGRILGPKGKMPNPKAGGIIPPKAQIEPLIKKLNKTIRLRTKNEAIVKCPVGTESMTDEELTANIMAAITALSHALPSEENNIKEILLKMTMSSPIKVGALEEAQNE